MGAGVDDRVHGATTTGNPNAPAAMRRHLERFTKLETGRDAIEAELADLATEPAKVMSLTTV